MSRTLRSFFIASSVACLSVGGMSGCADNDSSLFIDGVLVPQPPDCSVVGDPTQPMQFNGVLDVALRLNYSAALLVGNQLTPRGDKQNLKIETTRVNLRGAEITVTDAAGATIKSFSIGGTGFVDSNTGETPGWGIFSTDLLPASVGVTLAAGAASPKKNGQAVPIPFGSSITVYTKVQVYGDTLGGTSITSGFLTYPIEVCNGCLIQYPAVAIDTASGQNKCDKSTDTAPTPGCFPGQDGVVDCRNCSSTVAACAVEP